MRIRFEHAPARLHLLLRDMAAAVPDFAHVDPDRVHVIFSNSRSRTLAYCHEMSKRIQFALSIQPHYVIEVVHRNWEKMRPTERAKVLLHELYHIPHTFSGSLRNHKPGFRTGGGRLEDSLLRQYTNSHPKMKPQQVEEFINQNAVSVEPEWRSTTQQK